MEKIKRLLHNMFIAVGFGTMVYVPMLILDQGINDTMKSVLTWVFASLMYGLSFELLEIKTKIKYPIHILVCFIITIATRLMYSYMPITTAILIADSMLMTVTQEPISTDLIFRECLKILKMDLSALS